MTNEICDNDCEHCDWVTCPKMEEETETITVSKGCLKARTGRFVVYDVEYLKKHIDQEAELYGICIYHGIECDYKGNCIDCPHNTDEDVEWFRQDEKRAESEEDNEV